MSDNAFESLTAYLPCGILLVETDKRFTIVSVND